MDCQHNIWHIQMPFHNKKIVNNTDTSFKFRPGKGVFSRPIPYSRNDRLVAYHINHLRIKLILLQRGIPEYQIYRLDDLTGHCTETADIVASLQRLLFLRVFEVSCVFGCSVDRSNSSTSPWASN